MSPIDHELEARLDALQELVTDRRSKGSLGPWQYANLLLMLMIGGGSTSALVEYLGIDEILAQHRQECIAIHAKYESRLNELEEEKERNERNRQIRDYLRRNTDGK